MRLFALFIFSVASGAGLGFSATDVDNCESLECLSDIVSNGKGYLSTSDCIMTVIQYSASKKRRQLKTDSWRLGCGTKTSDRN